MTVLVAVKQILYYLDGFTDLQVEISFYYFFQIGFFWDTKVHTLQTTQKIR